MASMRDIKRRKSSITSTQQITKAMKLVSTVKLQKARAHAEATDPYFNYMYRTWHVMIPCCHPIYGSPVLPFCPSQEALSDAHARLLWHVQ